MPKLGMIPGILGLIAFSNVTTFAGGYYFGRTQPIRTWKQKDQTNNDSIRVHEIKKKIN